jgi:amino acid transporter
MQSFIGLVALLTTTVINLIGVRLLSIINNIGVGAEILGMLVFALILLFFANHQSPAILFDTSFTANLSDGGYLPIFLVGMFMALFVVYGFDTAGTFGEETVDAGRQAPRGVLSAIWLSGLVGGIFLLAVTLSFQDVGAAVATGQAFGFPIADTIKENLTFSFGFITLGELYLVMILIAVYVCTLAIQGATVRLMFSMGRDRRLPFGAAWGHVNHTFRTPANAAVAVGILGAVPLLFMGALASIYLAIAATGANYGVHGANLSKAGAGVYGTGIVGVRGESSSGRGGVFIGTAAQVRLSPSSASSHPASGSRGDLFVDAAGRLWFCKGATTWHQLA